MADHLVDSEANSRRIAAVERCFGASGQPLAIPGRVLVGEGLLTKVCRKRPKARQFFLFNDILVYGNVVLARRKYNRQRIIPLEEVSVQPLEANGQFKHRWLIETATKSFVVCAATSLEKAEWMTHIDRCVRERLLRCGERRGGQRAAPWVPDAEAAHCMRCGLTRFTAVRRRHHCRACGYVVCASCSDARFLLPRMSPKPLRVCGPCHRRLTGERAAPGHDQEELDDRRCDGSGAHDIN
ncbi:pleckstrin homology domain-containing family F member 1-like [Heterodontus francisci]|uniref:pleckstrin homology domain-containing family F member 1-like n=1 Tax=Heterodontus francisci TaxID=7792 RepID=UPI00355BE28C